jgi:enamine deaminase RidA (YjgF/YER057c/UK114 family)
MVEELTLVHVPELAPTPYAYAAIAPAGARIAYFAGACPLDEAGATLHPGDVGAQASVAVANLFVALAVAGAEAADVINTRVLVASTGQADLVAAWDVIHAAFADHEPPSTLLGVTVLGYTGQLVEIEAVAVIPG